jgi:hypothetical protein
VETAVSRLITQRDLDSQEHAVAAAEARSLAKKVDELSTRGHAATALPSISRRLEERLQSLEPQQAADALDELLARRAWRLAHPESDRSGSSPGVHHVGHES